MDGMNREARRAAAKHMKKEAATFPGHLVKVPRADWPNSGPLGMFEVWRSNEFLVQVYTAPAPCLCRLSINRTVINGARWLDSIPWDTLQQLKAECGYANCDAVEVYPKDVDVVNVANMRHLFVMAEPLAFAWRN